MVPGVPADGGAQEPAFRDHWAPAVAQRSCSQRPLPGLRTGRHTHSLLGAPPARGPALAEPDAQVSVSELTSLRRVFPPRAADVICELESPDTL